MFAEKLYKEFRANLRIDQMRLDEELMEHPMRLQSVLECATDAIQVRDACSMELKVQTAEATRRIREESEEKLSDAKASSLVILDATVKRYAQELEDAEHDLRYWQGLADSYREKGSALKRIAELTIAGYLAPNAAYAAQRETMNEKRRPILKKSTDG